MLKSVYFISSKGMKEISPSEVPDYLEERGFVWFNFQSFDSDDVKVLNGHIKVHSLTIEDLIVKAKRPKIEEYNGYIYLTLFAFSQDQKYNDSEVDFVLGPNYIISSYYSDVSTLPKYVEQRYDKMSYVLDKGPSFLLYFLIDKIVDDYFPVLDELNYEIDSLEDNIFKHTYKSHAQKIFALKKDILEIRKKIAPQREILSTLMYRESSFVNKESVIYFRDISDHLIRVTDVIDFSRDILTGTLDVYLSSISNKTNDIIKTLTIISTIVLPMTLIASIYGMNFVPDMPPFSWPNGYLYIWGIMLVIPVALLIYFKKKRWI